MRRAAKSLPLLIIALFACSPTLVNGQAQNRERFVISARAGGINAVTGRTSVHAQGSSDLEQLTIKDNLEAGDVVKTGVDGRVEVLLNPGSYMRVGENSEFELTDNSLESLEVRLTRGSAIVEATGADDTELLINITTPHAKMAIVRRGLYRVNVFPGDATELIVRKGRVLLADSQTRVQGGRKLKFSGPAFSMAKLEKADKRNLDSFEAWSKQRAETVAQANRRITGRDLNLFLSSFDDGGYRRFSPGSSGLWLFNSKFGCFTFLPFYLGWGSPYGGSYSNAFYGGYSCCGHWNYGGLVTRNPSGISLPVPPGGGTSGGLTPNPPTTPPSPTRDPDSMRGPERHQPAGGLKMVRPN